MGGQHPELTTAAALRAAADAHPPRWAVLTTQLARRRRSFHPAPLPQEPTPAHPHPPACSWAKYRMEITGREALSIILEKRRLERAGKSSSAMCRDEDAACEIPLESTSSKQQS